MVVRIYAGETECLLHTVLAFHMCSAQMWPYALVLLYSETNAPGLKRVFEATKRCPNASQ